MTHSVRRAMMTCLLFLVVSGCSGAGKQASPAETEQPAILDYENQLSRRDIDDLVALGLEAGGRPWRIEARHSWGEYDNPSALLYLPSDKTTTPELRRG